MENTQYPNIAYIDGQNLKLATSVFSEPAWKVDNRKFREYLRKKYKVGEAYYFIGVYREKETNLYTSLQRAGYILIHREHNPHMKSSKKGNVDGDIIFEMMKHNKERGDTYKAVLVSNDGDFFKTVDYLKDCGNLEKVLCPTQRFSSSLYKALSGQYYDYLDRQDIRKRIEYLEQ